MTDSTIKLHVAGNHEGNNFEGRIRSVNIKDDSNDEVMNYIFNDGNELIVPNTGTEKASTSDLVWFGGAKYVGITDLV